MKEVTAEFCRELSMGENKELQEVVEQVVKDAGLKKPYTTVKKLSNRTEMDLIARGFVVTRPYFSFDKDPIKIQWSFGWT